MLIWYFAYGSNLNIAQMRKRISSWVEARKATLQDYEIVFNIYSEGWKGGTANVVPRVGEKVYGALYLIDEEKLKALDRYESSLYRRIPVQVTDERGNKVNAQAYLGDQTTSFVEPTSQYLNTILTGLRDYGYTDAILDMIRERAKASS